MISVLSQSANVDDALSSLKSSLYSLLGYTLNNSTSSPINVPITQSKYKSIEIQIFFLFATVLAAIVLILVNRQRILIAQAKAEMVSLSVDSSPELDKFDEESLSEKKQVVEKSSIP